MIFGALLDYAAGLPVKSEINKGKKGKMDHIYKITYEYDNVNNDSNIPKYFSNEKVWTGRCSPIKRPIPSLVNVRENYEKFSRAIRIILYSLFLDEQ